MIIAMIIIVISYDIYYISGIVLNTVYGSKFNKVTNCKNKTEYWVIVTDLLFHKEIHFL